MSILLQALTIGLLASYVEAGSSVTRSHEEGDSFSAVHLHGAMQKVKGGAHDKAGWGDPGSVWKAGLQVHFDTTQPHAGFWQREYAGWEPGTFKVFQHLAKDKVVLDVGAWIGVTALWLGSVARRVVALEPTTAAFSECSANLATNPELKEKVFVENAALDSQDRTTKMSNRGDSMDQILSLIDVSAVTISTLVKKHPELEETGFVKIDTEGYERVIVPSLEAFFKEKKPNAYVSLHPMFISKSQVQEVVDKLKDIFPYLYEADMKTPFNTHRDEYTYGDHGGADVVCTWAPIPVV